MHFNNRPISDSHPKGDAFKQLSYSRDPRQDCKKWPTLPRPELKFFYSCYIGLNSFCRFVVLIVDNSAEWNEILIRYEIQVDNNFSSLTLANLMFYLQRVLLVEHMQICKAKHQVFQVFIRFETKQTSRTSCSLYIIKIRGEIFFPAHRKFFRIRGRLLATILSLLCRLV